MNRKKEVCRFESVGFKDDGVEVLEIDHVGALTLKTWREAKLGTRTDRKRAVPISLRDSVNWFSSRAYNQCVLVSGDAFPLWGNKIAVALPGNDGETWVDSSSIP